MKQLFMSNSATLLRSPLERLLHEHDWPDPARRKLYIASRIINELQVCNGLRAEELRNIWEQLPRTGRSSWQSLVVSAHHQRNVAHFYVEQNGEQFCVVGQTKDKTRCLFSVSNHTVATEIAELLNETQPYYVIQWIRLNDQP